MEEEKAQAAELERVLLRLGLTEDTKLCDVLRLLLPQLFQRLVETTSSDISTKIVEIFSHLVKRLKSIPSIQVKLPVHALLSYVDVVASHEMPESQRLHFSYARNFSLLFIEIGFNISLPQEEKSNVFVRMIHNLDSKSTPFRDVIFRLFLNSFLWHESLTLVSPQVTEQDAIILLDFFLDVLLFSTTSLPAVRLDRLHRTKLPTIEKSTQIEIKFKIIRFLKAHQSSFPPFLWYPHVAVGAAADFHSISTFCQEELSRFHKYQLEILDTTQTISTICNLILGTSGSESNPFLIDRAPLPDLVTLAMMPLLLQAKSTAKCFPTNLQLICTLLFGENPSRPRIVKSNIRKAGIELCQWVLSHADEALLLGALGPVLFNPLMKLLQEDDEAVPHELKVGVYAIFAVLSKRAPTFISSTAEVFQRLMYRAMVEEDKRSGSSCIEALRSISIAYQGSHVQVSVIETIKRELNELSTSPKIFEPKYDRVRGVLAQWAYAMLHSTVVENGLDMRLVCLRFSGDSHESVREIATKAIFHAPLPPFGQTIRHLHHQFNSLQGAPLDFALQLCMVSLKGEVLPESLIAADVQLFVECCMELLKQSNKDVAAETLVQLTQLDLGVLDKFSSLLCDIMLNDNDEVIREQMAILLASAVSGNSALVSSLSMTLVSNISQRYVVGLPISQWHGSICGLGLLLRRSTIVDDDIVRILVDTAMHHLESIKENNLSHHDYKMHSLLLLSSIQSIGAIGNSSRLGSHASQAAQLLLHVLDLSKSTSDTTDATKLAHQRALQSMAQLVLGLPIEMQTLDTIIEKLFQMADVRDIIVQFGTADVIVSLGIVGAHLPELKPNRVGVLLQRLLGTEGISSTNPHIRKTCSIWLFGIIACMKTTPLAGMVNLWHDEVLQYALPIHELLVDLLNEQSTLTQECAVKAMAMLYESSKTDDSIEMSDSLFKRLKCFRAFLDPTSRPSTESSAPDGPANGPSSNNTSAATNDNTVENACYREVSNVAAEVGDASVMYTLLYLSTNDPTWGLLLVESNTSTTIASILTLPFNLIKSDQIFSTKQKEKAHRQWYVSTIAQQLVPRLFLLKNHPNPKIGKSMLQLWNIFVNDDLKTLVHGYFHVILSYCLGRLELSRNFKYREAACIALVEILNGKEANDVRETLGNIWKLTARAVDDVNENVVVAGIKLVKCIGELSIRVTASDVACLDQVLPFLIKDGITSANKLCQALCMDYLLRLVKSVPSHHLKSYLATLPVTLLECMSSLEMPELQYAQFHVQDKRQLEKLRVSLSQAGPVGELLHACLNQLKQLSSEHGCTEIVRELCNGVCNILRSGVGLNTRVGSANFVVSLVTDVPFDLRQSGGAEKFLSKIFIPFLTQAVLNETHDFYAMEEDNIAQEDNMRDGLVVRAFCRAAAYVAKMSSSSIVMQYVQAAMIVPTTIQFADPNSGQSTTTRSGCGRYGWITVTALQELLQQLPPTSNHQVNWCADVFRVAFVGQFASYTALSEAWKRVLECIPPTLSYSFQYMESTLAYACELLSHLSWESRKQGASAIIALAKGDHSPWIRDWTSTVHAIQAAIPGRLWRGKGILLEALGTTYDLSKGILHGDIVNVLVDECERALRNTDMAYLESAIGSLGTIGTKSPSIDSFFHLKKFFFDSPDMSKCPPLLHKRMFESLGKWWPDLKSNDEAAASGSEIITWLSHDALQLFPVWSVQETIFNCLQQVVKNAPQKSLGNRKTMEIIVNSCRSGANDPKFAAVRKAALNVLVIVAQRRECVTEAPLVSVLAYKEDLIAISLAHTHDNEPLVCHAASQLLEASQQMP